MIWGLMKVKNSDKWTPTTSNGAKKSTNKPGSFFAEQMFAEKLEKSVIKHGQGLVSTHHN